MVGMAMKVRGVRVYFGKCSDFLFSVKYQAVEILQEVKFWEYIGWIDVSVVNFVILLLDRGIQYV